MVDRLSLSSELDPAIEGLEPREVWRLFNELRQIPRPSKKEEKVKQWIKEWAEGHGFRVTQDTVGNIAVHVPASEGCEDAPVVCLQAHLDMVCEKTAGSTHDFDKDPLKLTRYNETDQMLINQWGEADFVKAVDTTLGTDNGAAIVQYMAAATDPAIKHPKLELLFTVDEEKDLTGAENLNAQELELIADYLINLDTSTADVICVGCAGLHPVTSSTNLGRDINATTASGTYHELALDGFEGGHSGDDIHRGRGNPLLLLQELIRMTPNQARMALIEGGTARNVISRAAKATIFVPNSADEATWQQHMQNRIEAERSTRNNPNIRLNARSLAEAEVTVHALQERHHARIVQVFAEMPDGVIRMNEKIEGAVALSSNLGVVKTGTKLMETSTLIRGTVSEEMASRAAELIRTLKSGEFDAKSGDAMPGWEESSDGELVGLAQKAYGEHTGGKTARLVAFHSFIEPGAVKSRMGRFVQAVSFGPNNIDEHSPKERVGIQSMQLSYRRLGTMLQELSQKRAA